MLAAAAMHLGRGVFEADCRRCDDPALRRRWGCDGPTCELEPKPEVTCPQCGGSGEDAVGCEYCGGEGRVEVLECPWRTIKPIHVAAVEAAVMFEQHGVLPVAGGFRDQAHTFCLAWLSTLRREVMHYKAEAIRKANETAR